MAVAISPADISARLDRLPSSPRLWRWVARLSLGGFFEVYDLALTAVMSPLLVEAGIFHKNTAGLFGLPDQATFAFLTMLGWYLGSLGFSGVADRYSRRSVFFGSMLWYAVATTFMGVQTSAIGVCLWRFVAGIGLGAELVVIDCYLAEITPKALRGRVFSMSKFVQMCAVPAAGLSATLAGKYSFPGLAGWRLMAFTPAAGALLVLLLRRGIPESPRWLAVRGKGEQADRIVRDMEEDAERSQGIPLPEPQPIPEPPGRGTRYRDLFRPPHRTNVLMLIVTASASAIAFYGFGHWVPTLLEEQGVTVTKSLLYTGLISLAYPISQLIGASFADRIERKWQIVITSCLVALFGLLFARQTSPAMWILLGVLLTLSNEMKSTAIHTYRSELFPTAMRAKAIGFVYSFSRLAGATSSYLIAFVLVRAGVQGVFTFLAGVMGVSVVVTLLYGPRTLGRAYEEIESGGEPGAALLQKEGA